MEAGERRTSELTVRKADLPIWLNVLGDRGERTRYILAPSSDAKVGAYLAKPQVMPKRQGECGRARWDKRVAR